MTDLATEQEQNTKNRLQPSQIENVSTLGLECKKKTTNTHQNHILLIAPKWKIVELHSFVPSCSLHGWSSDYSHCYWAMLSYARTPRVAHTLLDLGRSTKVLGKIKSHPRWTLHSIGKIHKAIWEYKSPTPGKLYIQLGRSTNVLGNIEVPAPLNFTFNWENQQRK